MMKKISLTVITALMPEAVALIDFYRLQKVKGTRGFHLFYSDTMHLVVAGMGAARMTSGLRAYFEAYPEAAMIPNWLNLGIAGTRDIEIGSLCWAQAIAGTSVGVPSGAGHRLLSNVLSLDVPGQNYRADILFDMEAEACLKWLAQNVADFSPAQLFCAKVVSDNQRDSSLKIDREQVVSMFRALLRAPYRVPPLPLSESINSLLKS